MKGMIKKLLVGALLSSCANFVAAENITGATLEWPPLLAKSCRIKAY